MKPNPTSPSSPAKPRAAAAPVGKSAGKKRATGQRGGTFLGFVIGLVVGLAIAVTVALFVTRAPIPFIKQSGRPPEPTPAAATPPGKTAAPTDTARLPDPNKPLYPKDARGEGNDTPPAAATPPAETGKGGAPVIEKSAPAADAGEIRQSFLQAGAFRSPEEADNMKAKLALLGFEARVMPTERTGTTLYRVRVGPYGRADDLNRVKDRLTENGIQPTVVPVGQ